MWNKCIYVSKCVTLYIDTLMKLYPIYAMYYIQESNAEIKYICKYRLKKKINSFLRKMESPTIETCFNWILLTGSLILS